MKTCRTLQSIRIIAGAPDASESLVRFNRFTGKAVIVGSPGSRFGLVSWVHKLYTTNSDKKIRKFLLSGKAWESSSLFEKYLLNKMVASPSRLRTVRDLKECNKEWEKDYNNEVDKKEMMTKILYEVTFFMKSFNKNPGKFVANVSSKNCSSFYENYIKYVILWEQESPNSIAERGKKASELFLSFPKEGEGKDVYGAAVLEYLQDRLKKAPTNDIPKLLNIYVRNVSGARKGQTAKNVAEDCFSQWLSRVFIKYVKEARTGCIESAMEDAQGGFMCPEKAGGGEVHSHGENLGIRVKKLLDTHYGIGESKGSDEEGGKKASFHEDLQKDEKLREEVETRLRTIYVEHNKDFTKTVYISGTFLEHLPSEHVDRDKRSSALDAVLLQELDKIFANYQRA